MKKLLVLCAVAVLCGCEVKSNQPALYIPQENKEKAAEFYNKLGYMDEFHKRQNTLLIYGIPWNGTNAPAQ